MALQEQLDQLMANVRTQVPAEVLAPVDAFYGQALQGSNHFTDLVKVGQVAPDFELSDATGRPVKLSTLLSQGPVVLSFYRGAWCPFCNLELRALQECLPDFTQLGASLVAISPELPDQSMPLIERLEIGYPVLSDTGNAVARRYGLAFPLTGEALRISRDVFRVDLPLFNGDDSWTLPVPGTFVLDALGVVRDVFFDPDFRHRVEPAHVLEVLRSL